MRKITVLLIGGNKGIGKEAALQLAKQGARVILASRDTEMTLKAAAEITTATGNGDIKVKTVDLNSLKSVRALAEDIMQSEERLDVLINNAGAFYQVRELTEDGVDRAFSTNYLGHFLLTTLLVPLLKKSAPSRVVCTSSLMYLYGRVDFSNLQGETSYGQMANYGNAKLCLIMFVVSLAERLQGTGVTVNALHPGMVVTNLIKDINPFVFRCARTLAPFAWVSAEESGAALYRLAVSDEVKGQTGKLFFNSKEISLTPQACNKAVAKKLWSVSETLLCPPP